jgi:TolA-binding protein
MNALSVLSRRSGAVGPLTLLLLASSVQGCLWTKRSETLAMQARLATLEERTDAQAVELERLLEVANVVLLRNSADQGQLLQELRDQLGALEGQIAETRHLAETMQRDEVDQRREIAEQREQMDEQHRQIERRLDQIARAAGMDVVLQPSEIPRDRAAHFEAGSQALRVGSHSYARALFREYVVRYPTDDHADDAQYGIGASYLQQRQPAAALGEFRRILSLYRDGDVVDKTLVDMAEAFVQVRACADARASLEALIQAYPSSPLVSRARTRLREITRLPARSCQE